MTSERSAGYIPYMNFRSDLVEVDRVREAVLWLPEQGMGLTVARTFDYARRMGQERSLHERGKCFCCQKNLMKRPNGKTYGRTTQHVVASTFYRPNSEIEGVSDLQKKLSASAKPAELLVWTTVQMSAHGECYRYNDEPHGSALDRGPGTMRQPGNDSQKIEGQINRGDWLASAVILVVSE